MRFDQTRLLVFDTETTGTNVAEDRVVELGAAYFEAGARTGLRRSLVNPGQPIPKDATAVHRLTDDDVRDAPPFAEVGLRFVEHLCGDALDGDAPVLCGYNAVKFDVPILNAELARAGLEHRIDPATVIDPLIFVRWHHRGERGRTLEKMCARYGISLRDAHSAAADAAATGGLLLAMVKAGTVPATVAEARAEQERLAPIIAAEWDRWSYWVFADRETGGLRLGAGKHCGTPVDRVDPGYLAYLLDAIDDLPDEVRALFAKRVR